MVIILLQPHHSKQLWSCWPVLMHVSYFQTFSVTIALKMRWESAANFGLKCLWARHSTRELSNHIASRLPLLYITTDKYVKRRRNLQRCNLHQTGPSVQIGTLHARLSYILHYKNTLNTIVYIYNNWNGDLYSPRKYTVDTWTWNTMQKTNIKQKIYIRNKHMHA